MTLKMLLFQLLMAVCLLAAGPARAADEGTDSAPSAEDAFYTAYMLMTSGERARESGKTEEAAEFFRTALDGFSRETITLAGATCSGGSDGSARPGPSGTVISG